MINIYHDITGVSLKEGDIYVRFNKYKQMLGGKRFDVVEATEDQGADGRTFCITLYQSDSLKSCDKWINEYIQGFFKWVN